MVPIHVDDNSRNCIELDTQDTLVLGRTAKVIEGNGVSKSLASRITDPRVSNAHIVITNGHLTHQGTNPTVIESCGQTFALSAKGETFLLSQYDEISLVHITAAEDPRTAGWGLPFCWTALR